MRKKHQSLHISTTAKKSFCKEISLSDYTYEEEIRDQLNEYFNDNIKDEDIEDDNENNNSSIDEDIIDFKSVNLQKQDIIDNNEFVKFQISENAILNNIDDKNYEFIPKKNNEDDMGDMTIGDKINFKDIIKQNIFWKENDENDGNEDNKKFEIEPFELINLNPEKIKMIEQKIKEIKNIVKDKKMEEPLLNQLIKELENDYTEQTKQINNLAKNMENIDTISYGKNYSIVEYNK